MVRSLFLIIMTTGLLSNTTNESVKTYWVKKLHEDVVITGKGESSSWKNAVELTDFIYPWESETPTPTSFKALHSRDWLYLFYVVKDDNINVLVKSNEKSEILSSDRVEIFFRKDKHMLPYYGLEIDPNGRVYDYMAEYQNKFTAKWSWPPGELIIKANKVRDGYSVEVAISKKSLRQLGLINGNKIEAGVYRGDCVEITDDNSKIKWISWVRPDSPTPNFHIPSSFGILVLED
jgi:hypothetical protein